jgi:hypothetical protein
MKRILALAIALALVLGCFGPQRGLAQPAELVPPAVVSKSAATPGVEMAQALSTITGVAISPLLGVSAVGAWQYCQAATPAQRAGLPWFAQPWFWAPAFLVVALCALKDVFGVTMPALLKKPFDVLETIGHKVSGLVAIGAFVPLVATVFRSAGTNVPASLNLSTTSGHGFLAAIDASWLGNALAVPLMMWVFLLVFLASNAINILILLSPFPVVDAGLKLFRLGALGTVVATSFLNPWVGALWSLAIILLAWFMAGWSLRLWHFGVVFIWEICARRSRRFAVNPFGVWIFLARKIDRVPIRTYGRCVRNEQGALVFHYRPWLVLAGRTLEFPPGTYAVGKGLIYSEIIHVDAGQSRSMALLPPRYRSHEAELAASCGLAGVRDTGLRAAWAWLKEWLGFKSKPQPVAA